MGIRFKALNQLVYGRIRSEILGGKLAPGTRLKQDELTKRLGVSRSPVRDAILQLSADGLVTFIGRNSAVVAGISRKSIEEIFELRAVLEGYAAARAVERLTERDIEKLRKLISQMNEHHSENRVERVLAVNDEFHRFICVRAENEMLLAMLDRIWRDSERLRINYLHTPEGHETSTREHEDLVDGLESRDKERVRQIVSMHAARTKDGILATFRATEGESGELGRGQSEDPSDFSGLADQPVPDAESLAPAGLRMIRK